LINIFVFKSLPEILFIAFAFIIRFFGNVMIYGMFHQLKKKKNKKIVVIFFKRSLARLIDSGIDLVVAQGLLGDLVLGVQGVDSALQGVQGVRVVHELQERRFRRHLDAVHHVYALFQGAGEAHVAGPLREHQLGHVVPGGHVANVAPEVAGFRRRIVEGSGQLRSRGGGCGAPLARMLQEDEVPQWNGHVLAHSGHRGHRVVLLEHADLQAVVGRVPGLNAHQFHRVAVLGHRLIKLA